MNTINCLLSEHKGAISIWGGIWDSSVRTALSPQCAISSDNEQWVGGQNSSLHSHNLILISISATSVANLKLNSELEELSFNSNLKTF